MSTSQKKYNCNKCGETFAYFSNKVKHENECLVAQEKPNFDKKCSQCLQSFKTEDRLKRHLWHCTHLRDEKPYLLKKKINFCFFDKCHSVFTNLGDKIEHIYSEHENVEEYGLKMLQFTNKSDFERWMKLESVRVGCNFKQGFIKDNFDLFLCKKNCTSRIFLLKSNGVFICSYLKQHTCNMNPDDFICNKEFFKILECYICMGVNILNCFCSITSNEGFLVFFKDHLRYAKKSLARLIRELRVRLQRRELSMTDCGSVTESVWRNELIETEREMEVDESCDLSEIDITENTEVENVKEDGDENVVHQELSNENIDDQELNDENVECQELGGENVYQELSGENIDDQELSDEYIDNQELGELNEFKEKKLYESKDDLLKTTVGVNVPTLLKDEKSMMNDDKVKFKQIEPTLKRKKFEFAEQLHINKQIKTNSSSNVKSKNQVILQVKEKLELIDECIDSNISEISLNYISKLADEALNNIKFHAFKLIQENKDDLSSVILKYFNNKKDLSENVLFLNNNQINLTSLDLLSIVSATSTTVISDVCKQSDPALQTGRLTESIINAYFYRLSQFQENSNCIFGNTNLSRLLLSSAANNFFQQTDYINKTHFFLPVHTENIWTLIIFDFSQSFYGFINTVKSNNFTQKNNISKIINKVISIVSPKVHWKQQNYLSVYPKDVVKAEIFICFYLDRLTKGQELTKPPKMNEFRLEIFNTIRAGCLHVGVKTCPFCEKIIEDTCGKVLCKECLVSYHFDCVKIGDVKDFVCRKIM